MAISNNAVINSAALVRGTRKQKPMLKPGAKARLAQLRHDQRIARIENLITTTSKASAELFNPELLDRTFEVAGTGTFQVLDFNPEFGKYICALRSEADVVLQSWAGCIVMGLTKKQLITALNHADVVVEAIVTTW